MTTISEEANLLTVINVFTVENPQEQQFLVDHLVSNIEKAKKQEGLISVNIHKSLDGTRVINYAQWSSKEALETALKSQEFMAPVEKAVEFPHDFHLYEVVFTTQP
ncbi:antibiotic biosynthesis monooxygenase family protein [Nostoc sp. ChiVER01]|uniref:antibiotic biosynthesis monooxygenase family protein n=1 Tax=Nostoc sp. ChiVER01 TaxID=3075382 RepID=UPI002AD541F4|nr:antibiotic biosynthesis monooxygenase family protein [Nostoc sp. ChiVER01]MDZ8225090.1 antibiotic biosynthesis monooxygenase family protein [Nostoc sp. ChiVER01]